MMKLSFTKKTIAIILIVLLITLTSYYVASATLSAKNRGKKAITIRGEVLEVTDKGLKVKLLGKNRTVSITCAGYWAWKIDETKYNGSWAELKAFIHPGDILAVTVVGVKGKPVAVKIVRKEPKLTAVNVGLLKKARKPKARRILRFKGTVEDVTDYGLKLKVANKTLTVMCRGSWIWRIGNETHRGNWSSLKSEIHVGEILKIAALATKGNRTIHLIALVIVRDEPPLKAVRPSLLKKVRRPKTRIVKVNGTITGIGDTGFTLKVNENLTINVVCKGVWTINASGERDIGNWTKLKEYLTEGDIVRVVGVRGGNNTVAAILIERLEPPLKAVNLAYIKKGIEKRFKGKYKNTHIKVTLKGAVSKVTLTGLIVDQDGKKVIVVCPGKWKKGEEENLWFIVSSDIKKGDSVTIKGYICIAKLKGKTLILIEAYEITDETKGITLTRA